MDRSRPTRRLASRSYRWIWMPANRLWPGRQSAVIESIQVVPSVSWKSEASKPRACSRRGVAGEHRTGVYLRAERQRPVAMLEEHGVGSRQLLGERQVRRRRYVGGGVGGGRRLEQPDREDRGQDVLDHLVDTRRRNQP